MSVFSRVFGGDRRVQGPTEIAPQTSAAPLAQGNGHAAGGRGGDRRGIGRVDRRAEARPPPGAEVVVLEARDRVGGRTYTRPAATARRSTSAASGSARRRIASPRWPASSAARPSRPSTPARTSSGPRGIRAEYAGAIPTSDRQLAGDVIEALLDLTTMSSQVPLEAPWTAPVGGGVGRADDGDVDAGEHRLARRAQPGGAGGAGGLLGGAGGAVAAALPVLHALRRRHHESDRRDGRRAGEPLRRRGAVHLAEDGGGAGRAGGAQRAGPHRSARATAGVRVVERRA